MDAVVTLSLPSPLLRLQTILQYSANYLSPYLSSEQLGKIQSLLDSLARSKEFSENSTTADIVAYLEKTYETKISSSVSCPAPAIINASSDVSTQNVTISKKQKKKSAPINVESASPSQGESGNVLDIIWCVGVCVGESNGWSFREIEKFLQSVLAAILSTERFVLSLYWMTFCSCVLSNALWWNQVKYKKSHVHLTAYTGLSQYEQENSRES